MVGVGLVSNACILVIDMGLIPGARASGDTTVVVWSKVLETSTWTRFGDEEVLIEALPSGVGDTDNDVDKVDFGFVDQVGSDIKIKVDGKIVEALTRARVGDVEDMVIVWGSER